MIKRTLKNKLFPLSVRIPQEIQDKAKRIILAFDECDHMSEDLVALQYEMYTGRDLFGDVMKAAFWGAMLMMPIFAIIVFVISLFCN